MGIIPAEFRRNKLATKKPYLSVSEFVTFIICWMVGILDVNGTFYWAIETVCIRTRVTAKEKTELLLFSRTAALERNAGKAEASCSYFPVNSQICCCCLLKHFISFTQSWNWKCSLFKDLGFPSYSLKCKLGRDFLLGSYCACSYLTGSYLKVQKT